MQHRQTSKISMRTGIITATLFAALALPAFAAGHGGSIGATGSIAGSVSGTSLNVGAPMSIGNNGATLSGAATTGSNGQASGDATLDRSGRLNALSNAAMMNGSATATVRSIGAGKVTMATANGDVVTFNITAAQARAFGLRRGSAVALTRTSRGLVLTNLTYLHSLTGRATVRRVSDDTITYVNQTGTHTISFGRGVLSRLHVRPGSRIMVLTNSQNSLQVSNTGTR